MSALGARSPYKRPPAPVRPLLRVCDFHAAATMRLNCVAIGVGFRNARWTKLVYVARHNKTRRLGIEPSCAITQQERHGHRRENVRRIKRRFWFAGEGVA